MEQLVLNASFACELRPHIDIGIEEYPELEKDALSKNDWSKLRMIKDCLHPFHAATLKCKGDDASIYKVFFTMDVLIQWFDKQW